MRRFVVTPEVVEDPEGQLHELLKDPSNPDLIKRFEAAKEKEFENIKAYVATRAEEFQKKSGLQLSERRMGLIAALYLKNVTDINAAFDDFKEMVEQIRLEEASMLEKFDIHLTFDDSAIDAIIDQAIKADQDAGSVAFDLAKKLEYGLKLVKERAGVDSFSINEEAVLDMEKYVNDLIKKYYRQEYQV